MDFVRWLKRDKFDKRKMRFTSVAFRKSKADGCLSLVDEGCALSTSKSIAAHGRAFYPAQIDNPVIWWSFPGAELPNGFVAAQEDSDTGDKCHYSISNVEDADLKQMLLNKQLADFSVETLEGYRSLEPADLD